MSEYKFCIHCGVQIQVDQISCPNCKGTQPTTTPSTSPNIRTKFCVHCGERINYYSEICPKCGVRQTVQIHRTSSVTPQKIPSKNPALAAILNVLLIGLGHLYLGKFMRGLGLFIISVGILTITTFSAGSDAMWGMVIVLWLFAGYDGYNQAKRYNILAARDGVSPW